MTGSTKTLRLGPLPRNATVKLTITLSVELKETLDRYAAVHSEEHKETVDAATLIPHMLEVFMMRDRVFRKLERPTRNFPLSVPERDERSSSSAP